MVEEGGGGDVESMSNVQNLGISFEDMGLSSAVIHRIEKEMGLTKPTTVQAACMLPIVMGRNCIVTSPTDSGKAMAFAIPMLHCGSKDHCGIYGLILTPTREMAQQIKNQFEILEGNNLRITIIMGGGDMQSEALELMKEPHFIVATPGRLAEHIDTGGKPIQNLFGNVKLIVYDETVRLLGGQFDKQLETITSCLPAKNQTLMFSATITEDLKTFAEIMSEPDRPFVYNYLTEDSSKSEVNFKKNVQNLQISFEDMGLSDVTLHRIEKEMGLTKPTAVQAACMLPIVMGRHCNVISPRGSGKTMAFAIPMLHCWLKDPYGIYGLILTPTREKAQQIKEQFEILGGNNLRTIVLARGKRVDMLKETVELNEKPHFVVATPGRMKTHIRIGGERVKVLLSNVKFLVYDDADCLSGRKFRRQLKTVNRYLPEEKQVLSFSATAAGESRLLASLADVFVYNSLSEDPSNKPKRTSKSHSRSDFLIGPMLKTQNPVQKYIISPPDFKDVYMIEVLRLIHQDKFPEKIKSLIIFVATCWYVTLFIMCTTGRTTYERLFQLPRKFTSTPPDLCESNDDRCLKLLLIRLGQ